MKKISTILDGVIVLALGLVIAICGAGAAFDLALGIVLLIDAAIMLTEVGLILRGTKILPVAHTIGFALFLVFGLALVCNWFAMGGFLLALLVWGIVAIGGALVLIGCWTIVKGLLFTAIGEIVVGGAAMTLAILTMTVPGMMTAFNIILGVIVAGYGLMILVLGIAKLVKGKKAE